MTTRPDRGTELCGAAIGGAAFGFLFIGAAQTLTTETHFGWLCVGIGAILGLCSIGFFLIADHHSRKTP